jgi:hypothetical protein
VDEFGLFHEAQSVLDLAELWRAMRRVSLAA